MAINDRWYTNNGTRKYPLCDRASGVSDRGDPLPSDLLVDGSLRFPRELGRNVWLGSVLVTPTLVSLTIVSEGSGAGPVAIASLSLAQPAITGQLITLQPLVPGVSGHVVLGLGSQLPFSGRFSTVAQGRWLPTLAVSYPTRVVRSLGVQGAATVATTNPAFLSGNDVHTYVTTLLIDGYPKTCAVLELRNSPGRDVFNRYLPPAQVCPATPITSIAGVPTDCGGNIVLNFRNLQASAIQHGIKLKLTATIVAACGPKPGLPNLATGQLPAEFSDRCS